MREGVFITEEAVVKKKRMPPADQRRTISGAVASNFGSRDQQKDSVTASGSPLKMQWPCLDDS